MTAQIITLAEAVKTELNTPVGVTWSQTFTAERKYLIRREIEDIPRNGWLVSVVKAGLELDFADRGKVVRDLILDVGIQKKINPEVLAEGDAVLNLADEVEDYWLGRRPAAMTGAICISVGVPTLYSAEQVIQMRVATAIIRLTFRTWQ